MGRPGCVLGDFNDLLDIADKKGGDPVDLAHLTDVRNVCVDCDLRQVGFSRPRFTWSNNRYIPHTIEERLDFALVNGVWDSIWPRTHTHHLQRFQSDHSPIVIQCSFSRGRRRRGKQKRSRLFRFEEIWLDKEEECSELITHV